MSEVTCPVCGASRWVTADCFGFGHGLDADPDGEDWRNRRARPLAEFIPLPKAQLIAALRGWYTGRILGLIDVGDPERPILPFRILSGHHSERPRWLRFPEELLSEVGPAMDHAAVVLESSPLAMMDAPRTNGESLQAYTELIKLGMTDPTDRVSEVFEYPRPHPVVCMWIDDGRIEIEGERTLPGLISPEASSGARRQQLLDLLEANRAAFKAQHESYFTGEVLRSRDRLNGPPLWPGLHQQIDAAHAMLSTGVTAHQPGGGRPALVG